MYNRIIKAKYINILAAGRHQFRVPKSSLQFIGLINDNVADNNDIEYIMALIMMVNESSL